MSTTTSTKKPQAEPETRISAKENQPRRAQAAAANERSELR